MAKLVLIVSAVVFVFVLAGCSGADARPGKGATGAAEVRTEAPSCSRTGKAQASMAAGPTIDIAKASEADLAEQLAVSRQVYRQGLEAMVQHYTKTGNNMKLTWAKKELAALNAIPQYKYIVEATVAGANLKAAGPIPDANSLYAEAVRLEEKAGKLLLLKNDNLLRQALDTYNQLIIKYPTSDKIDDAAFRSAGIYEHLGDYKLALLYYQRTYQWNPQTSSPARFKAAFIFDRQFHQRDEALRLYQDALQRITKTNEHSQWQVLAEQRVKELSGESKPRQ